MYSDKETPISGKLDWVWRNKCRIRKTRTQGDSLYVGGVVLKDKRAQRELETAVATAGASPRTILANFITKAINSGLRM